MSDYLDHLGRDLWYGARSFVRTPVFTCVAIATLALAIGMNTALFSIIYAVLFRPLPYKNPDRLVAVWNSDVKQKGSKMFAVYRDFEVWKAKSQSFEDLEGLTWATGGATMRGRGPARGVLVIPTTLGLFTMLGVTPEIGRTFQDDDLARGCTVVLSHDFWREIGANADIVNQTLQFDNESCAVVGVMPSSFVFFPDVTEAWQLIGPNSRFARNPDQSSIGVFGRLKPGVSQQTAQSELRVLAHQIAGGTRFGAEMQPVVYPLQDEFLWLASRTLRLTLFLLLAAVLVILLIACANIASLLLSRSLDREKELAIRSSLGAGRGRLGLQLLVENLFLSGMACFAGVLIAEMAVQYFRAANPVQLPPGSVIEINLPVLAFTTVLGLLTTLFFGLLPAYKASKFEIVDALRVAGRSSQTVRSRRTGNLLIVFELTASVLLLSGASLLSTSILRFASAPLGFRPGNLIASSIGILPDAYANVNQRNNAYQNMLDHVASLPGVQGAALSTTLPLSGNFGSHVVVVERGDTVPDPKTAIHDTGEEAVTPGYFAFMGIPLLRGREFTTADGLQSGAVAVINEALAKKYFKNTDPVGQHIRMLDDAQAPVTWLMIVGVTGDEKSSSVYQEMGWADVPLIYRPFAQQTPQSAKLLLRFAGKMQSLGSLQRQVASIDPAIEVDEFQTIEQLLSRYLRYPRFRAVLVSAFALIALLLAIVGLYGALSQLVAQRTHEIGVRLALGAQTTQIIRMVVKQGLALAFTGIILGLVLAAMLNRFIQGLLYGVQTLDPLTVSLVAFLLAAFAFLAAYIPGRRAASVDPQIALRVEQ